MTTVKVVVAVLLTELLAASFLAFLFIIALGGAKGILTDWCRRRRWYVVWVSLTSIVSASRFFYPINYIWTKLIC